MRLRRHVLAAALGGVVAVLAVEVGLRLLGQFAPPPPTPVPRRPELYRADPDLGYTLRPSTRVAYRYPETSSALISVVSNADGFRNAREFDEPDTRPRIWVLGDSMVLGEGVAAEERLTETIGRLAPDWRVDNLGMTGWGVDLMVRAFEKISRRLRPDVVVLAFYTDDFRRLGPFYAGQGYPLPKFEVADGALIDLPFPGPLPAWRRLRVVQAVEQTLARLDRNRFGLNAALLDRLQHGIGADARLAVVFLPGRGDTAEDRQRRAFLADWCAKTSTPFLDLTETMHGAGVDAHYISGNPHWNARGHRLAGESIHRFLRDAHIVR